MKELKILLCEQKKAKETHDLKKLCEINIKIFNIREQERKKREVKREAEREAKEIEKILLFCEKMEVKNKCK